ncbi:hypothetical protein ABZP36_034372 [Zizania latifolia]
MICFTLAASHGGIVHASSLSFDFDFDFSNTSTFNLDDFTFNGSAAPHGRRFDLTDNSYNATLFADVGRVTYVHPVPLRDSATGEPLAHYPSSKSIPPASGGGALGLCTNSCLNASAVADKDRFVAVEFDTFSNPFDPNLTKDHMGIDLSSLRSLANITLPSFSLNGTMSARVDYNSNTGVMNVELKFDHSPMFGYATATYNMSAKVNLTTALPEQVAIGFSAATGRRRELHQLLSWSFSLISPSTDPASNV